MDFNAPRWTPVAGTPYEIDARTAGGEWTRIRGGGLSRPIQAKFLVIAGSPRLVGLLLNDSQPITARQLREARIAKLESAFGRYIASEVAGLDSVRSYVEEMWDIADSGLTDEEREEMMGNSVVLEAWGARLHGWIDRLGAVEDGVIKGRGRGASPPSERELRAFARLYLEQQLDGRHGAITRTATEAGMHRSTANRWIKTCQDRGLLPPNESETP